jgi:hypothetical protein
MEIISRGLSASSWGTYKNYANVQFTGDSLASVRFLAGAVKGLSVPTGEDSFNYTSATEWRDSYYKSVTSGTLYDQANQVQFSTDSFFSSSTVSAPSDFSATNYPCAGTVDATITMDFSDPAVMAIGEACERERFDDYDMCDSSSINSAMQKIFN